MSMTLGTPQIHAHAFPNKELQKVANAFIPLSSWSVKTKKLETGLGTEPLGDVRTYTFHEPGLRTRQVQNLRGLILGNTELSASTRIPATDRIEPRFHGYKKPICSVFLPQVPL